MSAPSSGAIAAPMLARTAMVVPRNAAAPVISESSRPARSSTSAREAISGTSTARIRRRRGEQSMSDLRSCACRRRDISTKQVVAGRMAARVSLTILEVVEIDRAARRS